MKKLLLVLMVGSIASLIGCDETYTPKSDEVQRVQQEQMTQQANAQTGMPGITNFTEKKIAKKLYELRDQNIGTFTYLPDMSGHLWHLCDSIGYGLPYGVQFSNPEKFAQPYTGANYSTLPQAEPNGLFMPPTAEGTWVICGTSTDLKPVYVEPRIVVSPFRLKSEGEYFQK